MTNEKETDILKGATYIVTEVGKTNTFTRVEDAEDLSEKQLKDMVDKFIIEKYPEIIEYLDVEEEFKLPKVSEPCKEEQQPSDDADRRPIKHRDNWKQKEEARSKRIVKWRSKNKAARKARRRK